jgi:hypothetical protein
MHISPEHTAHLLRHGFVVVRNFLTPDEIQAAKANLLQYVPTAEELAATPHRYGQIFEEPESLQQEFPFAGDALNHVSTHPDLIAFLEQLLGTDEVRLSQAATWAKYAGTGADYEQALHLDYQGNTLVVPRDDGAYRQVNMILYYTDVDEELGPTFVVSQEHTRDYPLWPTHRPRKKNADLYRDEQPVLAGPGDLLIFSMRTWHRASDITADSGMRLSHHFIWRGGGKDYQGFHLWPKHGENPELQRFIEGSTPRQREVLGFPKVGDPYWNDETIEAVKLRYPGMDVSMYEG